MDETPSMYLYVNCSKSCKGAVSDSILRCLFHVQVINGIDAIALLTFEWMEVSITAHHQCGKPAQGTFVWKNMRVCPVLRVSIGLFLRFK